MYGSELRIQVILRRGFWWPRSGADKISIGGDAVYSAEEYYANDCTKTGKSSIEKISEVYGKQAVVVSIDPKRVYVNSPEDIEFEVLE